MASLRPNADDGLGESWVELSSSGDLRPVSPVSLPSSSGGTAPTPAPCLLGEAECLRLLREAQRESSGASSARFSSPCSSRRDTPWDSSSPKSPPNSPNAEMSNDDDLRGVYVNYCGGGRGRDGAHPMERNTDWIWDWSSRPDQQPPKGWNFKHPARVNYSIRTTKVGRSGLFSKEVLYTLFITNVISLLIGTGIGMWLSRRGFFLPRLSLP